MDKDHLNAATVAPVVSRYKDAWLACGYLEQIIKNRCDRRCRGGTFYDYHGKIKCYRGNLNFFYAYVNEQFRIYFTENEKKILDCIFEGHYRSLACDYDNCLIGVHEALRRILSIYSFRDKFPLQYKYYEGDFSGSVQSDLKDGRWDRVDTIVEDICKLKDTDMNKKDHLSLILSLSLPFELVLKLTKILPEPILHDMTLLDQLGQKMSQQRGMD